MLDTNDPISLRLFLCGAIALILHVLLGILLSKPLFTEVENRSVPVQIVLPSQASNTLSRSSQSSTATQSQQSQPLPAAAATLNPHQVVTHSASNTQINAPQPHETSSKPPIQEGAALSAPTVPTISTPTLPDFRSQLNKTSSASAANSVLSDFARVFTQKAVVAENVQISSENETPLDEYELALLKKVVESQFGNKLYPFRSMDKRRKLVVEIKLLTTGQVIKARVTEPSGDAKLDAAALKGALNASPYPPPPPKDAAKGYKYLLPIIYEPVSDNQK